jgi:hypothetical protein
MSFIFLETNHKFIALTVSTHKKDMKQKKLAILLNVKVIFQVKKVSYYSMH